MKRKVFSEPLIDAEFEREGYVILDLLTSEDVEHLTAFYDEFSHCHPDDYSATILTDDFDARSRVHGKISEVFRFRLLPVLDNYKIILGSYAIKQPNSEYGKVGLHQDLTFVTEQTMTGISLWCPLVEIDGENGWLSVVRGSHTFNSHLREPCSLPYTDLIPVLEKEYMTNLPMKPGQALFMDNRLFHASERNRSDKLRLVAAGVAVPEEGQLLYCHSEDAGDDSYLDLYDVPEDFYLRHIIGTRPREGRMIGRVRRLVSDLTEEMLVARRAELARCR